MTYVETFTAQCSTRFPRILLHFPQENNLQIRVRIVFFVIASVKTTRVGCRGDVGAVVSVDVSLVGTDAWYMEKLLIRDLDGGAVYQVTCDCWFDDGNDPVPGSRRMRHLSAVRL